MALMETVIVNHTGFEIRILGESLMSISNIIPAGGKYVLCWHGESKAGLVFWISFNKKRSEGIDIVPYELKKLELSMDNIAEFEEISVHGKFEPEDGRNCFRWNGAMPRSEDNTKKIAALEAKVEAEKDKVSSSFDAALMSSVNLRQLLKPVKICRNQCNHLIQTYVEGVLKMTLLYYGVAKVPSQMRDLYNSGKLTQLYNSLDRLEYILCDAKDVLGTCANDLRRIALVASMPIPFVGKDMEVCTKVDLLIGELTWNLELIEHALQPAGSVKLEWCPDMCRYILKRTDGSMNVVGAEVKPDMCDDVRTRARIDREDLQSGLEEGSIVIPEPPVGLLARQFSNFKHDTLRKIIIERCKVEIDRQSLSLDPKGFTISHRDLKIYTPLGEGASKGTYKGEWCGQTVVIATLKHVEFEELQKEVKQLLRLQHPKVVSFFGWDYTDDAPAPIKTKNDVKENLTCTGGYIVTEKMECDLGDLIETRRKAARKQTDSGGPFSHSVGLDILLQIVEAMLHLQKYRVMHRDLKPKNVLVNSRSSPRSDADTYYDVKLIDFGSAKLLEESNDKEESYNKGTDRYGAPEMMVGKEFGWRGKYDPSGIDVFSFAMTSYEIITGHIPFHDTPLPAAVRRKIKSGERPRIPPTILLRPGLQELMVGCWAEVPGSRPTFKQIQERLWTVKKELEVPSLM